MMKLILVFTLLLSQTVFALEIDEKLTLRILRVSESKKTMLINRGIEDGLAEGDHAKFFVTSGVVARGQVVKVSPTRSVWAIYRLVSPEYIKDDTVLNLKIASAVKITDDDSKMISKEPDVAKDVKMDKLDIPLSEGADDLGGSQTAADQNDMKSVMIAEAPVSLILRNWEIWGNFNLSMMTGTSSPTNGAASTQADQTIMDLQAGGEYYFTDESAWYSRFTLVPIFNYSKYTMTSPIGTSLATTLVEFGGGTHWHPFNRPSAPHEFIPFMNLVITRGSMSVSSLTYTSAASNGIGTTINTTGTSGSYIFGGGCKYYFNNGFGIRATIDFVNTSASFDTIAEANNSGFDFKQSGPKAYLGMSFRW